MNRRGRSHTLTRLTRTLCRCCGFTWMGRNWISEEKDRCLRCDSLFLSVTPLDIKANHGHQHTRGETQ